jgi:hypothetical protein
LAEVASGVKYASDPSYSNAPACGVVKFVPDVSFSGATEAVPADAISDDAVIVEVLETVFVNVVAPEIANAPETVVAPEKVIEPVTVPPVNGRNEEEVALVRVSVMFAAATVVALAATAIVARLIESEGVAGAVGEAFGVPART